MSINLELWKRTFEKLPSWPCPKCQMGALRLENENLRILEPTWSEEGRSHLAWEPHWIDEKFACLMLCSNSECGEVVAVSGDTYHEEDHDWDRQTQHWERLFAPKSAYPPPPIFTIIDECPDPVANELRKAFGLYWSDPPSAANRLRVAVEVMLNERRIPRTTINKKRKRERLKLHSRIEKFKKQDAEAADYLFAIKWLGNAGSHGGLAAVADSDLLDGFALIEHVVERIYLKRDQRLKKIASNLNKRKGRAQKGRQRKMI